MKRVHQMASLLLFLAVPATIFSLAGCGDEQAGEGAGVSAEAVKKEAGEAIEVTKEFIAGKMKDYQSEMEQIRSDIDQRIAELQEKAKEVKEEARKDIQAGMDDLKAKLKALEDAYGKMENASGKAWGDLESGFKAALEALKKTEASAG